MGSEGLGDFKGALENAVKVAYDALDSIPMEHKLNIPPMEKVVGVVGDLCAAEIVRSESSEPLSFLSSSELFDDLNVTSLKAVDDSDPLVKARAIKRLELIEDFISRKEDTDPEFLQLNAENDGAPSWMQTFS